MNDGLKFCSTLLQVLHDVPIKTFDEYPALSQIKNKINTVLSDYFCDDIEDKEMHKKHLESDCEMLSEAIMNLNGLIPINLADDLITIIRERDMYAEGYWGDGK